MYIYFFIYLFIMIFSIINIMNNKKSDLKIPYILISIFLILFTGFRDGLGGYDYNQYKDYFEYIPKIDELKNLSQYKYEYGYTIFNSIIKTFTNNSNILFFIISILTLGIILYINYKYCKYPFFALQFFLYKVFLYNNFVAMRQSFALSIFLLSIKYIVKRDILRYTLLIFLATTFHTSSIVLWPIYFLNKIEFRKISILKIFIVSILIFFMSDLIFEIFKSFFNNERYLIYGSGSTPAYYLNIIEAMIFIFIIRFFGKYENEFDKINYNLSILYFIITTGFIKYSILFRISIFLIIPLIFIFSRSIYNIKNKNLKVIIFIIFSGLFLLGFIREVITFDGGSLIDYSNVIFK